MEKLPKQNINEQLNNLHNELTRMKTTIRDMNLRASMLDIDIVSLQDPQLEAQRKDGEGTSENIYKRCDRRAQQAHLDQTKSAIDLVVASKEE